MTDWIEHNGGPQPVADDVWVVIVWPNPEGRYLSFGNVIEEASEIPWEGHKFRYRILNQHLIDAKQAEIDALKEDLAIWDSVFPDLLPDRLKSDKQLAEEDVAAKINAKQAEIDRLKDELETWQSVFPHIVPDRLKGQEVLGREFTEVWDANTDTLHADPETIAREAKPTA